MIDKEASMAQSNKDPDQGTNGAQNGSMAVDEEL